METDNGKEGEIHGQVKGEGEKEVEREDGTHDIRHDPVDVVLRRPAVEEQARGEAKEKSEQDTQQSTARNCLTDPANQLRRVNQPHTQTILRPAAIPVPPLQVRVQAIHGVRVELRGAGEADGDGAVVQAGDAAISGMCLRR